MFDCNNTVETNVLSFDFFPNTVSQVPTNEEINKEVQEGPDSLRIDL